MTGRTVQLMHKQAAKGTHAIVKTRYALCRALISGVSIQIDRGMSKGLPHRRLLCKYTSTLQLNLPLSGPRRSHILEYDQCDPLYSIIGKSPKKLLYFSMLPPLSAVSDTRVRHLCPTLFLRTWFKG